MEVSQIGKHNGNRRRVGELMEKGFTIRQTAVLLGISTKTVENHRAAIRQRATKGVRHATANSSR